MTNPFSAGAGFCLVAIVAFGAYEVHGEARTETPVEPIVTGSVFDMPMEADVIDGLNGHTRWILTDMLRGRSCALTTNMSTVRVEPGCNAILPDERRIVGLRGDVRSLSLLGELGGAVLDFGWSAETGLASVSGERGRFRLKPARPSEARRSEVRSSGAKPSETRSSES